MSRHALICLLLLLGILKCIDIVRRPTTNTKAVCALLLLLLSHLVRTLPHLFLPGPAQQHPDFFFAWFPAAHIAATALLVVSVALGIWAWIEMKVRRGVYIQGRRQALWATLISSVLLAFFLPQVGQWMELKEAHGLSTRTREQATTQLESLRPRTIGGDHPEPREFPDLNFRYRAPPSHWREVAFSKIVPDSDLVLVHTELGILFAISARSEVNSIGTEQFAALSLEMVRLKGRDVTGIEQRSVRLGGLDAIEVAVDWSTGSEELSSVLRVAVHNGYAYHVHACGLRGVKARIHREMEKLCSGFELIDPLRIAGLAATDFRSERFSYRVDLDGSSWVVWTDLEDVVPTAEMGVKRETEAFVIVPVFLMGRKPHFEALVEALISQVDVSSPDEVLRRETLGPRLDGLRGVLLHAERAVDGEAYGSRLRIYEGNQFAYLLAGWTVADGPENLNLLDQVMERVHFDTPERLPDPETFDARERDRHARVFNSIGLQYYNADQFAESAEYFRLAFEMDPDDSDYLENLVQPYIHLRRLKEALAAIEPHRDRFPDAGELHTDYAWVLAELGDQQKAVDIYARVFAGGLRDDDDFAYYVRLLDNAGEGDRALAEVDTYLRRGVVASILILKAELLSERGEHARAIDALRTRWEQVPYDTELAHSLICIYREAGQPRAGLRVVEKLLEGRPGSARTYYLRGCLEADLNWFEKAKASLEVALEKTPDDRAIKNLLDRVSGALGQGRNSDLKPRIAAVELPDGLLERLSGEDDQDDEFAAGHGAFYPRRISAMRFAPGKTLSSTEYRSIRILDDQSVESFSTLQQSFDPLSEEIFVNRLDVFDGDGRKVASGNVQDYYVLDDPDTSLAMQRRRAYFPVPGLKVDHRIEFVVTTRRSVAPERFPFRRFSFSVGVPVLDCALFIQGDATALSWHAGSGVSATNVPGGLFWHVRRPPTYHWEPIQREYSAFLPTLTVNDSAASWKDEVGEYLQEIDDRLQVAEETRKLARSLLPEDGTDHEKVSALARYVQENLTYRAIEFGRRARVMDSVPRIMRNGYGDCKDHSLLLYQLVRACGLDARLALVNTGEPVDTTLPSLNQFDHMIIYVPDPAGGRFIDCTTKSSDMSLEIPPGLAEKDALLLDAEDPRFVRIGDYSKDDFLLACDRRIEFGDDRDARVEETVTAHGHLGGYLRAYLGESSPAHYQSRLQDLLSGPGHYVEVLQVAALHLDHVERPVILEIHYRVKDAVRPVGDRLAGKLVAPWESLYLSTDYVKERRSPFRIPCPYLIRSSVRARPPSGYVMAPNEKPEHRADRFFGSWRVTVEQEPRELRLQAEVVTGAGGHPPERYQEYYETLETARRAISSDLLFEEAGD